MFLKKIIFFLSILIISQSFLYAQTVSLTPHNKYQKNLIKKIDLAIKTISNLKNNDFNELYKKNNKKFKDLFSIDVFAKKVLGHHFDRFSKKQIEQFKSLYFAYILILIQKLKKPPKNTIGISFVDEKIKRNKKVPITIIIKTPAPMNKVKSFKLIFLIDNKTKLLENVRFHKENIFESHKKQFNIMIKQKGIDSFLSIFKKDIIKSNT